MSDDVFYLKPNVLVEPLINQWYAWPYLVPPSTAALYVAHQIKIMQSFVATPQIHVTALKNSAMRGGPFINYEASKAAEVKLLIEHTNKAQAGLLKLADAIKALNLTLLNEADGHTLEPIYEKVPDILKGYVELVYDPSNQPSIRFIEGLLYRSWLYDESAQSIALSLVEQDERPFALSTPNLESNRLILRYPFASTKLDEFFKLKTEPKTYCNIASLIENDKTQEAQLVNLLTKQAPERSKPFEQADQVRIRYFGHACIFLETKDVNILFDPLVSYKYETPLRRYTYEDLPESIDYAVITHSHQDHCMFETLLQLRHKVKRIIVPANNGGGLADPSLKLILQNIGFKNVTEIGDIESLEIPGGEIIGLPFLGEHADLNIRSKLAYLVNLLGVKIICAADSNNIEPQLYNHIHSLIGDIDILFLGMECEGGPLTWLYGPLLTNTLARKMDQSRRLDGSNHLKAMKLINQMNPTQVFVYAMGQEPWLTFLTSIQYQEDSFPIIESNKVVNECLGRGINSERLYGSKEIYVQAK